MYAEKKFKVAADKLIANHQTIAVAESVTAGLIQNAFSQLDNATAFFEGGITAYNLSQKSTHLFIDPGHAIECNCVSAKVAEEMALGVSRSFKSDWGLAITGYAAPVPEINVDELFAWAAICFDNRIAAVKKFEAKAGDLYKAQQHYRDLMLDWLSDNLLKAGDLEALK